MTDIDTEKLKQLIYKKAKQKAARKLINEVIKNCGESDTEKLRVVTELLIGRYQFKDSYLDFVFDHIDKECDDILKRYEVLNVQQD